MTFEATQETAMTAALYGALGQTVSYVPQGSVTVSVVVIMEIGSDPFAPGFDVQTAAKTATARIQRSAVSHPYRGDKVITVDGSEYHVDDYAELNACEWSLTLRACNG